MKDVLKTKRDRRGITDSIRLVKEMRTFTDEKIFVKNCELRGQKLLILQKYLQVKSRSKIKPEMVSSRKRIYDEQHIK